MMDARRWRLIVVAGTIACAGAALVTARLLAQKKQDKPPLHLQTMGHFFVGGEIVNRTSPNLVFPDGPPQHDQKILVNQAYVDYLIPEKLHKDAAPIVFAHAGITGMIWQTTVDGREGWDKFFARRGFPVYVIEPPGTGRSGFDVDQIDMAARGQRAPFTTDPVGHNSSYTWFQYAAGTAFPTLGDGHKAGNQMANDLEAQKHYLALHIPSGPRGPNSQGVFIQTLEKVKAQFGQVIYVGWSGGSALGNQMVIARPDLFKAVVGVETSNCTTLPTLGFEFKTPRPQEPIDPKVASAYATSKIPWLNLNSEAGHADHAGRGQIHCRPMVEAINAQGGRATEAFLPDFGITGNSHQMMSERNSDDVAQVILNWIESDVLKTKNP